MGKKKKRSSSSPATPEQPVASTSTATPPPPLESPQISSTSSAPPTEISPQIAQLPQIEECQPLSQYGPFLPEGWRFPPPVNAAQMYRPPAPLHIQIVEDNPDETTFQLIGERLKNQMGPRGLKKCPTIIGSMDYAKRFVAARGYEIVKFLGCGAYGLVFLVHYMNRPVQIDVQQVQWGVPAAQGHLPGDEEYQSTSWGSTAVLKFLKPFRPEIAENEIRGMVRLKHPFVVRILDAFFYTAQTYVIVMEHGPYGDLSKFVQKVNTFKEQTKFKEARPVERYYTRDDVMHDAWWEWKERKQRWLVDKEFYKPISFEQAWHWAKQVALAAHYINHQSLRHGDLHSANSFIFESEDPRIPMKLKLGDFGAIGERDWSDPDTEGLLSDDLSSNFDDIARVAVAGFAAGAFRNLRQATMQAIPICDLLIEVFDFTPEQVEANRTGKLIYTRIPTTVMVRDSSGNLRLSRSYVFAWGVQKEGYVKFKGFPDEIEKGEGGEEESDSD